jgi:transporter family protein
MHYLVWSIIAMLAYSFVAPFVRRAMAGGLPPFTVLLVTASALFVTSLGVPYATGQLRLRDVRPARASDAYWAGAFLTVGIVAYYQALSQGPVSVVVPLFGLFLVLSPLIAFVLLGEAVTARKLAGIALGAVAVYLIAGG